MNILILSAGTRNKVVQYFKKEVGAEGKVVATGSAGPTTTKSLYITGNRSTPKPFSIKLFICKSL